MSVLLFPSRLRSPRRPGRANLGISRPVRSQQGVSFALSISIPKSLTSVPQDYLYDLAKSVENLSPESRDLHLAALGVSGLRSPDQILNRLHAGQSPCT
jgi:hypothetical protein